MDAGRTQALMDQVNGRLAAGDKAPFQFKTIPQGAATSVWAGVVAAAEETGGRDREIATLAGSCRTMQSSAPSAKAFADMRAGFQPG
jgi:hypothetical protein